MIGHRGYPIQMQYSSREYYCNVTFLKVGDISVPLQSRSFPSSGSPPPGSGALPKRFLKLTTLYGTGQQEIGEFQISGSVCEIQQQRTYHFSSTDSVSVTKLHIYVDEVRNSGLTGHVTIDLKEFIGEDDSEIYLEYPLAASSPRHRAAKLQVVVQCKGPAEEDNDDVLDMDLETFLYDEFPVSSMKHFDKGPDFEHLQRGPGSVNENNPSSLEEVRGVSPGIGPLSQVLLDGFQPKIGENNQDVLTIGQQQRCVGQQQGREDVLEIPSRKDFKGEFLGLDTILREVVAEYAQTRPFLVTGGSQKKAKDSKRPKKSDLQAAVFFAAGVTMHQRLQELEINHQSPLLRVQESADHSVLQTTGGARVLLRSQSDEFDVKRVLSSQAEMPKPEVVTLREATTQATGFTSNEVPFSACSSPSPAHSAQGSNNEMPLQGRRYVQRQLDFEGCLTWDCSTAESKIQITPPCKGNLSSADDGGDDSTVATSADEETQLLIPGSNSKPTAKRSTALVVVRNILGILFIAGVSFGLGAGAHAGRFLGPWTWERSTNVGSASKWSEIQQMAEWNGTLTSQMRKPPNPRPIFVANEIGVPGQQQQQGNRKIMMPLSDSSNGKAGTVDVLHMDEVEEKADGKVGANFNKDPAGNTGKGEDVAPLKQLVHELRQRQRLEQPGAHEESDSDLRRRKVIEERVEPLHKKMLRGSYEIGVV